MQSRKMSRFVIDNRWIPFRAPTSFCDDRAVGCINQSVFVDLAGTTLLVEAFPPLQGLLDGSYEKHFKMHLFQFCFLITFSPLGSEFEYDLVRPWGLGGPEDGSLIQKWAGWVNPADFKSLEKT